MHLTASNTDVQTTDSPKSKPDQKQLEQAVISEMDVTAPNTVIQITDSQKGKPDQKSLQQATMSKLDILASNSVVSIIESKLEQLCCSAFLQLEQVLGEKVILPNSKTPVKIYQELIPRESWLCHVCNIHLNLNDILSHNGGRAHRVLVNQQIRLLKDSELHPPVTKLQVSLDKITNKPLIGVEYILELVPSSSKKEITYICLLCSTQKCDPVEHLTNYKHKMTYLSVHFKKAHRCLQTIMCNILLKECERFVDKVAWAIQDTYGRLKAKQISSRDYAQMPKKAIERLSNGVHFEETEGRTFEDIVIEEIGKAREAVTDSKPKKVDELDRCSSEEDEHLSSTEEPEVENEMIDCLSSDSLSEDIKSPNNSDVSLVEEGEEKCTRVRNPASVKGNPTCPRQNPRIYNQCVIIENDKDDYENKLMLFNALAAAYDYEMEKVLMKYRKNPYDHPQYYDEWKKFWERKFIYLKVKGKDTSTYDFKPEWMKFWNERMLQLHNEEIQANKIVLSNTLELLDEPLPPVPTFSVLNNDREVIIDDDVNHENSSKKGTRSSLSTDASPQLCRCEISSSSRSHRRDSPSYRRVSPPYRRVSPSYRRVSPSHIGFPSCGKDGLGDSLSSHRNYSSRNKDLSSHRRYSPSCRRYPPSCYRDSPSHCRYSSHSHRYSPSRRGDSPYRRRYSPSPLRDFTSCHRDERYYQSPLGGRLRNKDRSRSPRKMSNERSRSRRESPEIVSKRERYNVRDSYNKYSDTSRYKGGDEINLISVLRLLTAIEDKLGSLGPKVINLLTNALVKENERANSSEELLDIELNYALLMTIAEKLRGRLLAGLVDRVNAKIFRTLIKDIESVIHIANQRKRQNGEESAEKLMAEEPGVGCVLKKNIFMQIINSLVSPGRTRITQNELGQMTEVLANKDESRESVMTSYSENVVSVSAPLVQGSQNDASSNYQSRVLPPDGHESFSNLAVHQGNVHQSSPLSNGLSSISKSSSKQKKPGGNDSEESGVQGDFMTESGSGTSVLGGGFLNHKETADIKRGPEEFSRNDINSGLRNDFECSNGWRFSI